MKNTRLFANRQEVWKLTEKIQIEIKQKIQQKDKVLKASYN